MEEERNNIPEQKKIRKIGVEDKKIRKIGVDDKIDKEERNNILEILKTYWSQNVWRLVDTS